MENLDFVGKIERKSVSGDTSISKSTLVRRKKQY